jgi:hypothetical protein
VLDNNLPLVRLLVTHGADIGKADMDSWTPLHAAAANGHVGIVRYLMDRGADTQAVTEDGETALDLVDGEDYTTMAVLLDSEIKLLTEKKQPVKKEKKAPAWVRRESLQEEEKDTRRKGSAWVGKDKIPEEEEEISKGERKSDVQDNFKEKQRREGTVEVAKPVVGDEISKGDRDKGR